MSFEIVRALLVEDNPADARLFREYVKAAGQTQLQLTHALTLGQGIEHLRAEQYDIVLLDLSLPDASGLETVIQVHALFPTVPIVVLSGLDDEPTAARAVREGAQDYLVKGRVDGQLLLRSMRYAMERFRAIEALRRREEHFRALIEHALDLIAIIQPAGIIRYASPSYERILGWRPGELTGINMLSLVHPEDHAAMAGALSANNGQWHFECRFRHKDGTWRVVESSVRDLSNVPGVQGTVVNSRDVTERRNFEERLQHANQTLRAVVQASPLAIYSVNMDGTVQTWNSAAEKMFGWAERDVVGHPVPPMAQPGEPSISERLEQAREGQVSSGLEMRFLRREGSTMDATVWSELLRDSGGTVTGLVDIVADVTERKLLEQQVRQSQKMDAIARLAGGVAHDFNNLLTVITGYTHLLLAKVLPGDPARGELEQVARAAERAGDLTLQLVAFSRRQLVRSRTLDLGALMVDAEPMLRRAAGDAVDLNAVIQPDIWPVLADPGQVEQVLLNLALNARDAMPRGGVLTIAVANCALDGEAAAVAGVEPGRYVSIVVRDTGVGMSADVKAHVFEPFFTTKEQGKGTGLGLSTSYGIIRQNAGNIRVLSEIGKGAAFTIWLPAAAEGAVELAPERPDRVSLAGSQTVLLYEDEPEVRSVLQDMLSHAGYQVLACASPEETMRVAERHDGDIDLLISELRHPRAGGTPLEERVRRVRPNIAVLYISGPSEDPSRTPAHNVVFLRKPFTPETLSLRVTEALSKTVHGRAGDD